MSEDKTDLSSDRFSFLHIAQPIVSQNVNAETELQKIAYYPIMPLNRRGCHFMKVNLKRIFNKTLHVIIQG